MFISPRTRYLEFLVFPKATAGLWVRSYKSTGRCLKTCAYLKRQVKVPRPAFQNDRDVRSWRRVHFEERGEEGVQRMESAGIQGGQELQELHQGLGRRHGSRAESWKVSHRPLTRSVLLVWGVRWWCVYIIWRWPLKDETKSIRKNKNENVILLKIHSLAREKLKFILNLNINALQ